MAPPFQIPIDRTVLFNLGIAALGGLAVGTEREWSGHARGPARRIGGVRTFALLGLVAGLSGWLWTAGLEGPATILLAGVGALVIIAYLSASRHDVDGTTEVAAFVVLAAGVLAGAGLDTLASGIIAATLLLLVEKRLLHGVVSKIDRDEIRAGARFAVMAAVVLPLLPAGPYGPFDSIRPRQLWMFVLLFSGLSFLGYVLRRTVGRNRGYAVSGALGGVLSSTSVTLSLSRLSRSRPQAGRALASGTLGASVVLFPRVLIATALIAPALSLALWPWFVVPVMIGVVLFLRGIKDTTATDRVGHERNPLEFKNALQMAALFQVVLIGVAYTRAHFGQQGVYGSAVLLGAFEVDALTISMAQLTRVGTTPPHVTATAVIIGILSNTVVKFVMALLIGRGRYRPLAAIGLALMAIALGAALVLK
jgi:uncharacterized membrane protein (DUF4010 family)